MPFFNVKNYLLDEQLDRPKLRVFIKEVGQTIGLVTALLGLASFVGYIFDIEFLFRPIANGPATNPLTAMAVVFVAISIEVSNRPIHKAIPLLLAATAAAICLLHMIDIAFDTTFSHIIMPFQSIVDRDNLSGKSNSMGLNTALMLLLLATSHLFYNVKLPIVSQLLSFTALCVPVVSITGYAYGLTSFYGSMSLLSTTFGVFLCLGTLAITADTGGVRAVLSPYIGGKIARIQILLGYFVPLLIGYMVIRSLVNSNQNSIFGIYVVSICWFIALLVVVSAIMQERVDSKRREMERLLQHTAMTDELTQLPNRRCFMASVSQKLVKEREMIHQPTSWVLMIDIDHFKRVNDTSGHAMGDKVLIEFSRILQQFVRSEDLICRLGGEEFAIFLSDMTKSEVKVVAEKIITAIANMDVLGYTDIHGHITTSIGASPAKGKVNVDQALKASDNALYLSKNSGRNQVNFIL